MSSLSIACIRTDLIVGIKDHKRVALIRRRQCLPERLEVACARDHVAIVASVVVRHDHGICAKRGDVVDGLCQVAQVVRVQRASHLVWDDSFHQDVDSKHIHALRHKSLDRWQAWPSIVDIVGPRQVLRSELDELSVWTLSRLMRMLLTSGPDSFTPMNWNLEARFPFRGLAMAKSARDKVKHSFRSSIAE